MQKCTASPLTCWETLAMLSRRCTEPGVNALGSYSSRTTDANLPKRDYGLKGLQLSVDE
jgi:hypothetical protein